MEKLNENSLENSINEFATKLYPEKNYDSFYHAILKKFTSLATSCFTRGYKMAQNDRKKLDTLRDINFKKDFMKVLDDINTMVDSKHKT